MCLLDRRQPVDRVHVEITVGIDLDVVDCTLRRRPGYADVRPESLVAAGACGGKSA
jgi:hypothetical protein